MLTLSLGERDTVHWLIVVLLWTSLFFLLLARQDGKSHAGECGVVWRLWDEDEEKRMENLARRARLHRSALGKPTMPF
jgi:hypothetical protein